nr:HAMP domain-containing sensor histidine kinase [Anaerovorax odorimutans]
MLDFPFYIESYRQITPLFHNRQTQYRSYISLLLLLFAVGIVVTLIVSAWLMRPIKKLSKAARQLSDGCDIQPVPVYSRDEIGQLTQDFNSMAGQLAENVEELKDAAQRQELFVSSFNHELKTPLTSMIGYADLLRSKKLSEEQVILSADQIVQEGRRLEKLSATLMELIVIRNQEIPRRHVSAHTFFNSVRNTVLPIMKQKHIDFSTTIEDGVLLIEPDLMKTVCINLLDNAYKAVQEKGQICLRGVCKDSGYEIIVSDDGCGIPQEELSKITEAFYMVDKARARAGGGSGLGLAICARIVEVHNGTMEFASRPGEGTQVTIGLEGGCDDETA